MLAAPAQMLNTVRVFGDMPGILRHTGTVGAVSLVTTPSNIPAPFLVSIPPLLLLKRLRIDARVAHPAPTALPELQQGKLEKVSVSWVELENLRPDLGKKKVSCPTHISYYLEGYKNFFCY